MPNHAGVRLISPISARDSSVQALLAALTTELDASGYPPSNSFGYSTEQLERASVHLVGASVAGKLVGLAGVELQGDGVGELKRFYVAPQHRGTGVADLLIVAVIDHARSQHVTLLRLETGDKQHAAISFYRRHSFHEIPRFGPYVGSSTSICMERALNSY